ncbi:phosphoinositide-interacting protein-like [Callorhinchus milii]|uniref:Phosphoinositide interacting regulator of transient receptor potential channels n=1 Tax=Callorhinchus milii TaxID=7868 RepID=A0A4W3HQG8_CALMI|nr:phosphoinositide-interacting protein-like [Callorhinchus milii]
MEMSSTENIDLGVRSCSESNDLLTSQTVSSFYGSSRSESLWALERRSAWEIYHKPIIVMSIGGAFFLVGCVLTGLYFADITKKTCNVLGPAALSIGLMFLVYGLVWVPIIKEKRQQKSISKFYRNQKMSFIHL